MQVVRLFYVHNQRKSSPLLSALYERSERVIPFYDDIDMEWGEEYDFPDGTESLECCCTSNDYEDE